MGDTIEDTDIEKEQKDNKIETLENDIGLPDCEVIEEMNKLGLNKMSSEEKEMGLWIDWIIDLTITNTVKTKSYEHLIIEIRILNYDFW